MLNLVEELPDNAELPLHVTVASGFPKGDKLEWVAQKTTELGAAAIWAFPADWSVAKWPIGLAMGMACQLSGYVWLYL